MYNGIVRQRCAKSKAGISRVMGRWFRRRFSNAGLALSMFIFVRSIVGLSGRETLVVDETGGLRIRGGEMR